MALQLLGLFATAVGFDPVFSIALAVASYQNQYYAILRLDEQSAQQVSQAEREDRAKQLADKVLHTYESLSYLSFTQETIDVWCMEGSPRSYLPMAFWPKEPVATAQVWMGLDSLHAEIFSQEQHIYSLFLKDMQFLEYRWPVGDQPGAHTRYFYDPRYFRLCRGVDGHLQCATGGLRKPWLGKLVERPWYVHAQKRGIHMSSRPENWRRMIADGRWIGRLHNVGEPCDVVILDQDDIDRRDVFLVNDRRVVTLWYTILRNSDDHKDKYIVLTHYRDISTAPIRAEEFEPSRETRETAKNWREVGGAEGIAEVEENWAGGPFTPWLEPPAKDAPTCD